MDKEIALLKKDQEYMNKKIDHIDKKVDKIFDKLDNLDNKFASKLTETIVYGMVGLILTCVISALIYLVVK